MVRREPVYKVSWGLKSLKPSYLFGVKIIHSRKVIGIPVALVLKED